MMQKRLYTFQEELERLSRENQEVQLHINEYYSAIGKIISVEQDFIRLEETQHNGKNKWISIQIERIVYIRELQ